MGKLFKSWFKKKKQESIIETPFQEQKLPPTKTTLYTSDETPLNFTHGSLLDDVLNGLKDHQEYSKPKNDSPDLPLSSSVRHLDSWSKIGTVPEHENQQKQTIDESYGNNGPNTHHSNKVSQTYLCSPPPTPETFSDALSAPPRLPPSPTSAKVMTSPSSAATPSSSSSSLSPPRLIQTISHYDTSLATTPSPTSDSEESSSSPDTVGSNDLTSNGHYQQRQQKSKMIVPSQQQQQDTQQRRHSSVKSPSIASRESNQDKKNHRYSQATGVSMSRMKERHRQECRRSMQSSCQQQLPSDTYPHVPPPPSSSSTHHPSFQSTPLLGQQQHQKTSLPKSQQNRHLLASPSMPSIYPVESMSPPLQTLSQQHYSIPAATNSATSYSIAPPLPPLPPLPPQQSPPLPPGPSNTISMARSPSLMTDIHYQQSSLTPGGNIGTMTMSPLANDFMHPSPSWRQQPLFPYQSDIILPPYSPSQLGTFQQQQQQQIMQSPYHRIKPAAASLLPRSASVYGNVNQYHYKYPHDIHHGSGILLRPSPTTMDLNGNRKLVPASTTRHYQPQLLSISTQQPSLDQPSASKKQQQQQISGDTPEDILETSTSLPAFFLPSSTSPSKEPIQQQQKSSVSSSSSSMISSACTTPTNIDQKSPAVIRNDGIKDDTTTKKNQQQRKKGDSNEIIPTTEHQRKKKHRQRRRFSLPTTMPTISLSRSSSSISSSGNQEAMVNENLGKLEIGNDPCPTSACLPNNGMHLCNGGIHSSTYNASPSCCLPPPPPLPHHHHHHYPHYVDHPCSYVPPPLPCCQPPPPPPPSSCCSSRSHHHHHRSHRHHHHHRHHSTKQQQMRKSKSCMTKVDMEEQEDDAMTIGSTTPIKKQKQHRQSMPSSKSTTIDDDDDDYTVNGEESPSKMKTSPPLQQQQKTPFLRSLLPRTPRFTSLPRTVQNQQKKMTTSKSSYSWISPRTRTN